jgi:hypothetical protein
VRSRSRSAIENCDVVAATFVVGDDLQIADFSTIHEAIANLPSIGGTIFCLSPSAVTDTITFPDKPVTIEWAAGASIDSSGLGTNPLFEVPNGLSAVRQYILKNLQVAGDATANQTLLQLNDANSFGKPTLYDPYVTGVKIPFDIQAGSNFAEPTEIRVVGGRIVPPTSDGTSVLCASANPANTYAFGASVIFDGATLMDPLDFTKGWNVDFDGDIILQGPDPCFFVGASRINGLLVEGGDGIGSRDNPTTASIEIFGGSYIAGDGGIFSSRIDSIIVKASGYTPFSVSDCQLIGTGKIILNTPGCNVSIATATWLSAINGPPDYSIDILAGADDCVIANSYLVHALTSCIRTAAQRTRVIGCRFTASGGTKTITDAGAGDHTLGVGNTGVSTGGGLSLAANSKVTVGDYNFA